jgi:hypothetical protein
MHYILFYDYVPDMAERRTPHRPDDLALVQEFHARGEIVMAGAWGDVLDGAAIVFKVDDAAKVAGFVDRDPYVGNGLVTAHRVRPWTVVAGG